MNRYEYDDFSFTTSEQKLAKFNLLRFLSVLCLFHPLPLPPTLCKPVGLNKTLIQSNVLHGKKYSSKLHFSPVLNMFSNDRAGGGQSAQRQNSLKVIAHQF